MWRFGAIFVYLCLGGSAWAGDWAFDGHSEATEDRASFYSASISQKDMRFTLLCNPANRHIALSVKADGALAAAELSDRAAKAAAGGGAYDLLIKDTAYARSAAFNPQNGTLLFTDPVGKNGRLLEDIMSAEQLVILNSPLKLSFPLHGSRDVICEALSQCRIEQSGCRDKGF